MPTEAVGALQEACCGAVAVCACACLLTVCMLRDPAPQSSDHFCMRAISVHCEAKQRGHSSPSQLYRASMIMPS